MISEVVRDTCGKCTENQKANVGQLLRHYYETDSDKGVALDKKYDPYSKNVHQLETFLSEN